ncbi:ubiquitin-like domain-containing protein [Nephila pilipes]|uniref:Ubiquitin-like domain-containing protein n=1 Tax=Nephila pilipes TaxID=299642 RepID=A0A8X6UJ61_NEPPI|nr:ubiquitin-like domain-containing protein [Nephila pilipes]
MNSRSLNNELSTPSTLVTFIGNGSQLYSVSPAHTRTLPVQRELPSQQSPVAQVTNLEPPANNRTLPPFNPSNLPLSRSQDALSLGISVEEVGNDTEDHNSSDEARPSETGAEDVESETPTAPTEEDQTENVEEQSTQSDSSGIRIRLKYLDDTERTVRSDPFINIADFKRSHFSEDLANNKVVRLIFCGHLLRDNSTLESYRVVDNSVIHVQILQAQTNQNRSHVSQNTDLDLSNLLWPLVYFHNKEKFNAYQ